MNNITYIPVAATDFSCSGKISLSQTVQEDERGKVWKVSFRAVTTDDTIRKYDGRDIYVGAVMTDGSIRIFGSPAEAPRLEVTPYAGANLVTCSYESAEPVDL